MWHGPISVRAGCCGTLQPLIPLIGSYFKSLRLYEFPFSTRVSLERCATTPHISKLHCLSLVGLCEGSNIGSEWSWKLCFISHTVPSWTQLVRTCTISQPLPSHPSPSSIPPHYSKRATMLLHHGIGLRRAVLAFVLFLGIVSQPC